MSVKHLLTIVFLYLSLTTVGAQTNRALLVAIDKYPEGSGWNKIHATNDIQLVVPMLGGNGYTQRNIVTLLNEKATKATIIAELTKLIDVSCKGDYIYIHFSCHGQLMADDNGDEPNGYDEALIPYDARRRYSKGVYEGKNHLRDDELRVMLDRARKKIGDKGNLTIVFDACHSGTADRNTNDDTYVRGTTYIFAPPGYVPQTDPSKVIYAPKKDQDMAPITILSACLPEQVNYEHKLANGKYYGTLTYGLYSTIMGSSTEMTVSELFDKLTLRITKMSENKIRKQTPDLQSTHEDKTFNIGRK